MSDGAGCFRLHGVPTGLHFVSASHPDHPWSWARVEVAPSGGEVDVIFPRGYTVEGRVVDDEGRPVEGATVTYIRRSDETLQALTDGSGVFRFSPLHPGLSWFRVHKPGYASAAKPTVWIIGESEGKPQMRLFAYVLSGTVSGLDPADLATTEIYARPFEGETQYVDSMLDAEGMYRLQPVRPGAWWVTITDGVRFLYQKVEIAEGTREAVHDFEFAPSVLARGQVLQAGQPVEDAYVTLRAGRESASTRSTAQGQFELETGTADRYFMGVLLPGWEMTETRELERDELERIVYEAPVARVSGIVVDAEGKPKADVDVRALPQDNSRLSGSASCRTGKDGRFVTPVLPDGRWSLELSTRDPQGRPSVFDRRGGEYEVEIVDGESVENLELIFN